MELVKPTHLALQAVDLNTLINHSLQLVSQDANSREIQLRFTANDTLPEIQADPGQADSGPVESLSQCYSGDWSAWRD